MHNDDNNRNILTKNEIINKISFTASNQDRHFQKNYKSGGLFIRQYDIYHLQDNLKKDEFQTRIKERLFDNLPQL